MTHPTVAQLFQLHRAESAPVLQWPPCAKPALGSLVIQLRAKVEPPALEIYDSLRGQNKRPFAAVVDGMCTGCHFRVAVESLQALEARSIALCQVCGRFLHPPNAERLILT
jgi:predicted CXXCH cytochrome family protein